VRFPPPIVALPPPSSLLPPLSSLRPRALIHTFVTGIYFVLFSSSVKVLLTKRKTISAACTLLALAGLFGVLITWVSLSDDDPERRTFADLGPGH
jgi:hypothetical protein